MKILLVLQLKNITFYNAESNWAFEKILYQDKIFQKIHENILKMQLIIQD